MGMTRCPDCCRGFESEADLREHAQKYHDLEADEL